MNENTPFDVSWFMTMMNRGNQSDKQGTGAATPSHITTESGDILTTEGGDQIITET